MKLFKGKISGKIIGINPETNEMEEFIEVGDFKELTINTHTSEKTITKKITKQVIKKPSTYAQSCGWTEKYPQCKECGTSKKKHICKGLCQICYSASRKYTSKYKTDKGWTEKYPKCSKCETTEKKHHAKGLCQNCYDDNRRGRPIKPRDFSNNGWTEKYPECIECGTKDRKHNCKGLCTTCYNNKRLDTSKKEESKSHTELKPVREDLNKASVVTDYQCKDCRKEFQSVLDIDEGVKCPGCKSDEIEIKE